MKTDCCIVYSVTGSKSTKEMLSFGFINVFETEDQAKAALQYEADVSKNEGNGEVKWLDENAIELPEGYDPDQVTIVTYDTGHTFHSCSEPLIKYVSPKITPAEMIDQIIEEFQEMDPEDFQYNGSLRPRLIKKLQNVQQKLGKDTKDGNDDQRTIQLCKFYHLKPAIKGWENSNTPILVNEAHCSGTREQDLCSCGGDPKKCNLRKTN